MMSSEQIVASYLARKADALVRGDSAFFDRTLHPRFTYVNTHGSKLNKSQYISQFSDSGDFRFVSQVARDVETVAFGDVIVATMVLSDTFDRAGVQSSHEFHSLCVFLIANSNCYWVAGQTMQPVRNR